MSGTPESVAVIGLGYVGLPLCRALVNAGFQVVGVDIDRTKVEGLSRGESPVTDISDFELQGMMNAGFEATSDFSAVSEADVILFALPTPVGPDRQPDLAPLLAGVDHVVQNLRRPSLLILESTVAPGMTENTVLPRIEDQGKVLGKDFFLAFSPERVDPGGNNGSLTEIPKVVAGVDDASATKAVTFYESVGFEVVKAQSVAAAEAAKLLENTYRAVNMALVNELAPGLHALGLDIGEVIRLASTKPFGFQPFYPGAGVGGHCIPIDPWYLESAIASVRGQSRITRMAMLVNEDMPRMVTKRIHQLLGGARGGNSTKKDVLLLGMTYKPNVSDFRESPGPKVALALNDSGVDLGYHDPFLIGPLPILNGLPHEDDLDSALAHYRLIVVLQRHNEYAHLAGSGVEGVVWVSSGPEADVPTIWSPDVSLPSPARTP